MTITAPLMRWFKPTVHFFLMKRFRSRQPKGRLARVIPKENNRQTDTKVMPLGRVL